MKDNLFRRYIIIFAGMLLTSTIILGMAFLYFSAQNFSIDKKESLRSAAERAKSVVSEEGELNAAVEAGFKDIQAATGVTVFFTDAEGNVLLCSEGKNCIHTNNIPKKAIEAAIMHGSYASADYFGGMAKRPGEGLYQFCFPVEGKNGETLGFVFAVSPITALYAFLINLGITFLAAAGVMFVGSIIIVYYSTKRLTKPLREMSAAARSFGSGDFTARVDVGGDDELANLASAFNNMAESLDELERTRRSFIANVSHELRTPMTTIGGYIDGILDGTIPRSREAHYLTIVSDEVKRLSRLTSSLLDISRLEEGQTKVNLKNSNAWDTILSVMWNAEKRINDKQIEVEDLEVKPAYVICDADMLYQVVYNLIDNAIKFTPTGGLITVKVQPSGALTAIKIRNSGAVISQEEAQHIFERFYKTDKSRGLDRTGTGLGLYIVKALVGRMDGGIEVTSEQGKYTEFCVTLKTGAEEKGRQREQALPVFSAARTRVTVVRKKPSIIDILSEKIKNRK